MSLKGKEVKMGYLKYLRELWKKPKEGFEKLFGPNAWRDWLVQLRSQPAILRIEKPTRPDRARALGYKAKQGIFIVRARITKGGRKRPKPKGGRRPKRYGRFIQIRKSDQVLAEERAARKYPNAEVLNSYWVGEDGKYKWYEIIMVDRSHPAIKSDKNLSWLTAPSSKRRVFRGKTSAGRKSRGLRKKGKGTVKFRPSKRKHKIK